MSRAIGWRLFGADRKDVVNFRPGGGIRLSIGNHSEGDWEDCTLVKHALLTFWPSDPVKRGTSPAGGQTSMLGLRFNPPGASTTIPVLAK